VQQWLTVTPPVLAVPCKTPPHTRPHQPRSQSPQDPNTQDPNHSRPHHRKTPSTKDPTSQDPHHRTPHHPRPHAQATQAIHKILVLPPMMCSLNTLQACRKSVLSLQDPSSVMQAPRSTLKTRPAMCKPQIVLQGSSTQAPPAPTSTFLPRSSEAPR
jgi:hypothetical protein